MRRQKSQGGMNLDERIMNMVSLIADQVQTKQELFSKEGRIMDMLMSIGYRLHEADAALTLMQSLALNEDNKIKSADEAALSSGVRTMTAEERLRFTHEAFSFIIKLAHLDIITMDQREDIIDKAMSLNTDRITENEIKSIAALSLFANIRECENMISSSLDRQGMVWN